MTASLYTKDTPSMAETCNLKAGVLINHGRHFTHFTSLRARLLLRYRNMESGMQLLVTLIDVDPPLAVAL